MNSLTSKAITAVAAIVIALMTGPAHAETYPFRVAFQDVPGAAELESGDVDLGIEILEGQIEQAGADIAAVLATLCGAYVIDGSLSKAERICNRAVDQYPGETAYNNRGVLRVFNGDFRGAEADFQRARPAQMAEYLEHLKTRDSRLIADGNFGLLEELAAKHSSDDVKTSVAANAGADVDPIEY